MNPLPDSTPDWNEKHINPSRRDVFDILASWAKALAAFKISSLFWITEANASPVLLTRIQALNTIDPNISKVLAVIPEERKELYVWKLERIMLESSLKTFFLSSIDPIAKWIGEWFNQADVFTRLIEFLSSSNPDPDKLQRISNQVSEEAKWHLILAAWKIPPNATSKVAMAIVLWSTRQGKGNQITQLWG